MSTTVLALALIVFITAVLANMAVMWLFLWTMTDPDNG